MSPTIGPCSSPPRKRGSRAAAKALGLWIPAFAQGFREFEFGCSIAARSTESAEFGGMGFEEKQLYFAPFRGELTCAHIF